VKGEGLAERRVGSPFLSIACALGAGNLRLVSALSMEANDEWEKRSYLDMEELDAKEVKLFF
jgi:hypothetical protein